MPFGSVNVLSEGSVPLLAFPGVRFPRPAELTGSPLENAIKAPLSVTNLIQDKPANPFTDYNLMAGGSLSRPRVSASAGRGLASPPHTSPFPALWISAKPLDTIEIERDTI